MPCKPSSASIAAISLARSFDENVATLKHLASEGIGDITLRAFASHLGYLEAWCRLATGSPLPWPAPESLLLKFVPHYLWAPVERAEGPSHGMPVEAEAGLRSKRLLRVDGPHAPETVRRRSDPSFHHRLHPRLAALSWPHHRRIHDSGGMAA